MIELGHGNGIYTHERIHLLLSALVLQKRSLVIYSRWQMFLSTSINCYDNC